MTKTYCDICKEAFEVSNSTGLMSTGKVKDIVGTAEFIEIKKGAGPGGNDIRHRHEVPFTIQLDTSKNYMGFDICPDCVLKGVTKAVNEINHPVKESNG